MIEAWSSGHAGFAVCLGVIWGVIVLVSTACATSIWYCDPFAILRVVVNFHIVAVHWYVLVRILHRIHIN